MSAIDAPFQANIASDTDQNPKWVVVFRSPLKSFAVTLWTLASVLPATAGGFEDAQAAIAMGDYLTAMRLLGTLADQNDPNAERLLGIMYIKGLGVPQDYAMGMRGSDSQPTRGWRKRRMRSGFCINKARASSERKPRR
jgi:hypothetical protein